MKFKLFYIFIIVTLLIGCKNVLKNSGFDDDPVLSLLESGTTDVLLEIKINDQLKQQPVKIIRNDTIIYSFNLSKDTLIWDKNLKPKSSYYYKIGFNFQISDSLIVNTLDTINSNITWETEMWGKPPSNKLFDVFALNPNNIWAVGEIATNETNNWDSSGNWINPYNTIFFNGFEWSFITSKDSGYGYEENVAIFALSTNDIWISSRTVPKHWDGQRWKFYGVNRGMPKRCNVNKIWALNTNEIFFACDSGKIIKYNYGDFHIMNQCTNINLLDIWGISEDNIWACGYTQSIGTVILHYNGSNWTVFHESDYYDFSQSDQFEIAGPITSIWTDSKYYLYAVSRSGFYKINSNNKNDFVQWKPACISQLKINNIRGFNSNDIVMCGNYKSVVLFNGLNFKLFPDLQGMGNLFSVYNSENSYYCVGKDFNNSQALFLKGNK